MTADYGNVSSVEHPCEYACEYPCEYACEYAYEYPYEYPCEYPCEYPMETPQNAALAAIAAKIRLGAESNRESLIGASRATAESECVRVVSVCVCVVIDR